MRLGVIERLIVGAGGEDEQISAAVGAGEQVVGHGQAEEAVAISLDDEDGKGAVTESVRGRPDRRNEWGQKSGNPGSARGIAKRRICGAKHEAIGFDAIENCGSNSGAKRESEKSDGEPGRKLLEKAEGTDCIAFALAPIGSASAAAIAGVVKDERSHAALREDALNGKPLGHNFADAVTDEDSGFRFAWRRCDKDGVDEILSTGDGVLRCFYADARRARARDAIQPAISYLHQAAGAGEGGGEEESLHGQD
jgi:hypothetical protein